MLFALFTGLRQGNVLKLEWAQVNLELRHAHVLGTQSKNRRPIAVPLNERALEVLGRQGGNIRCECSRTRASLYSLLTPKLGGLH